MRSSKAANSALSKYLGLSERNVLRSNYTPGLTEYIVKRCAHTRMQEHIELGKLESTLARIN